MSDQAKKAFMRELDDQAQKLRRLIGEGIARGYINEAQQMRYVFIPRDKSRETHRWFFEVRLRHWTKEQLNKLLMGQAVPEEQVSTEQANPSARSSQT